MTKYLFRIDDVHRKQDNKKFNRLTNIFLKYNIKPVVGLIPKNKSDTIIRDDLSQSAFLKKIKNLENKGWAIALHGYTHEKIGEGGGLLAINNYGEFGGLSYDEQLNRIKSGLDKLQRWKFKKPICFMATAHSFDLNTIKALRMNGIKIISDGIALYPYKKYGILFIPQILWRVKRILLGIITICLHPNELSEKDFIEIEKFIKKNKKNIVSFEYAIAWHKEKRKRLFFYDLINLLFRSVIWKLVISKKRYIDFKGKYLDPLAYDDREKGIYLSNYILNLWGPETINLIKKNSINNIVLDLGCGTGRFMQYCLNAKKIVGLDKSGIMLDRAKSKIKEKKNIKFIESDLSNNNLIENSFDFIVSGGLLEYVNHDLFFKEIKRLLKNNGKAIFICPNKFNPLVFLSNLYRRIIKKEYYKNEPSYFKIKRLLKKYNFRINNYNNVGCVFFVPRIFEKYFIWSWKILEILNKPIKKIFPIGRNFVFEIENGKI